MSGEAQSGPFPEGVPQSHQSVPVELSEGEFESWRSEERRVGKECRL